MHVRRPRVNQVCLHHNYYARAHGRRNKIKRTIRKLRERNTFLRCLNCTPTRLVTMLVLQRVDILLWRSTEEVKVIYCDEQDIKGKHTYFPCSHFFCRMLITFTSSVVPILPHARSVFISFFLVLPLILIYFLSSSPPICLGIVFLCVFHIKPFFLPIDIQRIPCPC